MKQRLIAALLALAITLPAALSACDPSGVGDGTDALTNDAANVPETGGTNPLPPDDDIPDYDGYVLTATADGRYGISDNLFGIFLEDLNYAVDGGLYAELVWNNSFEFGSLSSAGGKHAWNVVGSNISWVVKNGATDGTGLNENNPHYARVTNSGSGESGIANTGFFEGLRVEAEKAYNFTVFARAVDGYGGGLHVTLESTDGTVYAEGKIDSLSGEWHKYSLTLIPSETVSTKLRLAVRIDGGSVDLDMVSLIPDDVYEGSVNGKYGMRRDIAEMLEALEPKFFRFPGGCIIEGTTLEKAYDWKDSIGNALPFEINGETTVGDVASRPLGDNLWSWNWQTYYMSYGLGFYEYFLFCEDIGCEPVPVLNCGLSCQINLGPNGVEKPALNSEEFQRYIQDALDLVEFCMGGTDTEWGAVRAAMGHPEHFELTYIGIGNEQWGSDYNARYAKFREAFNEAAKKNPDLYGNIKLIMANGPLSGDTYGWDYVASKGNDIADLLDEHYYNEPSWFFSHTQRYDSYDREGPTVFVGEYAAKSNTSLAAMAEAAYMMSLERNGDIVELAAYAPLLAFNGHTQWTPDLVWFDSGRVWGSANYYVQKIFSTNQPTGMIPSTLDGRGYSGYGGLTGKIGLGTWSTAARFDDVVVTDNRTGKVLFSDDFSESKITDFEVIACSFNVKSGALIQSNTNNPANEMTGDVLYMGDASWSNYTVTFKARKTGGAEGFIIPFAVKDSKNFWHWNIGGWGNTVSTLECVEDGVKSGQIDGTVKPFTVVTGREYEIKIVVDGYKIKGYINDDLMIDFDTGGRVFSVVGEDEDDIIVKIINASDKDNIPFLIDLSAVSNYEGEASVQYIDFGNEKKVNTPLSAAVHIEETTTKVSGTFEYTMAKYTMVVMRIPKNGQ